MPRHDTIVIHDAIQGLVLGWNQTASAVTFASYVGGLIAEVGFTWIISGAVASIPVRVRVGYGPNGGPGISLMEYTLDTYLHPNGGGAGIPALVNYLGGTAQVRADLRNGSPGGVPITAANIYPFLWIADAGSLAAAPTCYLTYVIWRP